MFKFRKILSKLLYEKDSKDLSAKNLFNFKRVWMVLSFFTSFVAIVPLLIFAYMDYQVTQNSINSEISLTTSRLTNNLYRFITYFIDERKLALDFIVKDNTFTDISNKERLAELLSNLKRSFGGFTDLGIIDHHGIQITYTGPYELEGKDYSGNEPFKKTIEDTFNVSEVFLGYRNVPHLALSVRHDISDSTFYILRATIDDKFINIIKDIRVNEESDAFIVNNEGVLQTSSRLFGDVLNKINVQIPDYTSEINVVELEINDKIYFASSKKIDRTPFILMILQQKDFLIEPWYQAKINLLEYLIISVVIILMWILSVTTYVVKRLKAVDQKRIHNMQMAEHASRMASVGKLAAGVAHEINNPLAIINEKAGYIQDKFLLTKEYSEDKKVTGAISSIIMNVERCGRITKRLLRFSRQDEVNVGPIIMLDLIHGLLDFVHKEAQYRRIEFDLNIPGDFPVIYSDKGKLEQIILNLINNAIDALPKGGLLSIHSDSIHDSKIVLKISDNGIGIPKENLQKIFEPFYTTKSEKEGTGLGLSITYALVNELGGDIEVSSELGKGTTFKIYLPIKIN